MRRKKTGVLLGITILSLLAIGGVVLFSFIKKPKDIVKDAVLSSILGETTSISPTNSPSNYLDSLVKDTVNNTRTVISEKMAETQKNVITTIEKEVNNLTQSQIEALKLQICKGWGVITTYPTPSP